jgi:putative methionine-R-sulfoxide reductase with GAF domain
MEMLVWTRHQLAPPVFAGDENRTRKAAVLKTLVLVMMGLACVALLAAPLVDEPPMLAFVVGAMLFQGIIELFLIRAGHVRLGSVLFVAGQWLPFTLFMLATGGEPSVFIAGQLSAIVLTGLLLGGHAAISVALLSVGADVLMALFGTSLTPDLPEMATGAAMDWLTVAVNVATTTTALYLADRSIVAAFKQARANADAQREAARALEAVRDELEAQVANRTHALVLRGEELAEVNARLEQTAQTSQRRATLLQASAEVSHAVAQVRDVSLLLAEVTRLIGERFGVYHVGIFLLDDVGRYAILRAANSEGGRRMLQRGHRLQVGSEGIVGDVTFSGRPRLALDVGADATFFDNPDLPETRSEIALPLRIGDEIIGAIDVQSTQAAAFGQDHVTVLSVLADQVAIAIQNARLFQQSQTALAEAEQAYQRYLQNEWESYLGGRSQRRLRSEGFPMDEGNRT